jgi:hypothetical protein
MCRKVASTQKLVFLPDECAGSWRTAYNQSLMEGITDLRGCYPPLKFMKEWNMASKNNGSLTKAEAIKRIHSCAKSYKQNLLGKNLLFITEHGGKAAYFEVSFLKRNFKHFTGVNTGTSGVSANSFFDAALENRLHPNSFEIPKDGTVEMKLSILPSLMSIHKTARMLGDYNNSKSLLITDKIAGTITAVMGFIKEDKYYVPNTVLREDLRDITLKPRQAVLMMFIKNQKDKK